MLPSYSIVVVVLFVKQYHNVIDGYLSRPTFRLAILELRVQDLHRLLVLVCKYKYSDLTLL